MRYQTLATNERGDSLIVDLLTRACYSVAADGIEFAMVRTSGWPKSRSGNWSRIVPGARIAELINLLRKDPLPIRCPLCKLNGLDWHVDTVRVPSTPWVTGETGRWYLVDTALQRHYCEGTPSEPVEDETPDPSVQKQTVANPITDERIQEIEQLIEQVVAKGKRELARKGIDVITDVGALVVKAEDAIQKQVREAIQAQVPVVHEYRLIRPDDTSLILPSTSHYLTPLLLQFLTARVHTFLVGPAGSGKTTACKIIAEALGVPFHPKALAETDDAWTLVGHRNPLSGEYVPGCMYEPFKHGGLILLDEMDVAESSALVTLNSMLANQYYVFPNGERVEQHADFYCVAAGNTLGHGADVQYNARKPLDAATLDRFAVIQWPYDEYAEYSWANAGPAPVPPVQLDLSPDSPPVQAQDWVAYVQAIRASIAQHKENHVVSPRASIYGNMLLAAGVPVMYVLEAVIFKGMNTDMRARILKTAREVSASKWPRWGY